MKKPINEVAKSLGLHPFNLMLYLADMDYPLEEIWPEIEETWIEGVRSKHWDRFGHLAGGAKAVSPPRSDDRQTEPGLSASAVQVLIKLSRKRHWGHNTVSFDTLRNHYCQHVTGIEDALQELQENGFVIAAGKSGPFSLDPGQKGAIETMVQTFLSQQSHSAGGKEMRSE